MMLPEHIYFTGAGLLGYLLYVPVVMVGIGLLYRLLLRHISARVLRWGVTVVLSATLLSFPFWDVLKIGYEADKLCKEQGGLHVYKTVEAEGFLGASSIKYWSKYGFKYVEGGGTKGRKFRATIENGEIHDVEVPEYISRYQYYGAVEDLVGRFKRSRYIVDDIRTREKLGELVTFSIYPGRFDRLFLGLLPVEFNPWICGNEAPPGKGSYSRGKKKYLYGGSDVVMATIKPKRTDEGERK